jgi:small GTP-binding protein
MTADPQWDPRSPKIVVAGPAAAGKSSLSQMEMYGLFPDVYDPTIEDIYEKTIDGTKWTVIDTAGVDSFTAFRQASFSNANALILVFSLIGPPSWESIAPFYTDMVRMRNGHHIPVALVGNKVDMPDRTVSKEQGEAWAAKIAAHERIDDAFQIEGPVKYFETSAKDNIGVSEVFAWVRSQVPIAPPHPPGEGKHHWCRLI